MFLAGKLFDTRKGGKSIDSLAEMPMKFLSFHTASVDSTYLRTEVVDVQHPKGSLSARGCCIPESSHWRSDRLGAPNDRYEAVTGSSSCGHEQQQSLQSRSRHLKAGFRLRSFNLEVPLTADANSSH